MKKFLTLLATVLTMGLSVTMAHAADDAAAAATPTAQQSKMKTCNMDAKDKKGDERKMFMKECLSAKPAAAEVTGTPQQNKMKTCNADAKTKALKGDERKAFMKECLSNK
jgi:hypothetical protein